MSFVNVTSPAAGADCAITTVDELELRIAPPTITADASTYCPAAFHREHSSRSLREQLRIIAILRAFGPSGRSSDTLRQTTDHKLFKTLFDIGVPRAQQNIPKYHVTAGDDL